MLSYQHAYHAGNAADVVKHTLWAHLIAHLTQKEKPLHVYETHAGRGIYPLDAPEAQKLEEYKNGLERLPWGKAETPYLSAVARHQQGGRLTVIPGSPAVAALLLRPEDHLTLCEAHPAEFAHLQSAIHRPNLHLHMGDGHALLPKLIRPGQRNLVLLDPSYEVKSEYGQTVATVEAILKAAPQSTVMVWYPCLPSKSHQELINGLKELKASATWLGELRWSKPLGRGMYGTGQVVLNMPYQQEKELAQALKSLAQPLKNPLAETTTTQLTPRV